MMSTTTKMITSSSSSIQKVAPFSCPTVERTPVPQPMIERSVHPSRSYIYINFLEIIFIEWGNILTPLPPHSSFAYIQFFFECVFPYVINLHFPFSIALVASGPAFPLPRNHLPIFFANSLYYNTLYFNIRAVHSLFIVSAYQCRLFGIHNYVIHCSKILNLVMRD